MDDKTLEISIAEDFSITPGSRYKEEGNFSGEEFLETILIKKFDQAISEGKKLIINLDGTAGYATSFLEEVFGGLARKYGKEVVLEKLEIISVEEDYLKDDIEEYIKNV